MAKQRSKKLVTRSIRDGADYRAAIHELASRTRQRMIDHGLPAEQLGDEALKVLAPAAWLYLSSADVVCQVRACDEPYGACYDDLMAALQSEKVPECEPVEPPKKGEQLRLF